MKIPVPGTRVTGGSGVRSSLTKSWSGPSTLNRSAVTSSRPRNQVVITVKRITPIVSGSQAPWVNLVRFAPKKARSTASSGTAPSRVSNSGRCQRCRTMTKKRIVVIAIVPVTAIPNAKASLAEVWNARTSATTATSRIQLMIGHVDLPVLAARGVDDAQARQVAELRRLMGDRERAGDHRLRGDHGRGGRQDHQGDQAVVRHQLEERRADRARVVQDQRSLAEVAEDAGREDEQQPGAGDRGPAEVAHVGVEGLDPGDREDDGGEREEAVDPLWNRKSKA